MPQKAKKLILWDFDGTLAYRPGGWAGALAAVLRQSAPEVKADEESIRPFLQSGFPWHAPENAHPNLSADEWWDELTPLFARAFRGAGAKNGIDLAQKVRAVYADPSAWKLHDDVLPVLATLKKQGWTHVLLTNHVPELPALLKHLGLDKSFARVFNSAETGYEKPNGHAFRQVLDWAGPTEDVWVIGDSYTGDVVGAREAGLKAILVRQPSKGAELYCERLDQLSTILG